MSVCTDLLRPVVIRPRRIRSAECSAYADRNRCVNFNYTLNLTPDPSDNDASSAIGAWTVSDVPATIAFQDVSDRGDDLLFVAMGYRVSILDFTTFQDELNWETFYPIYRKLTLGPIPGSADEQQGKPGYDLTSLKRFRRLDFELAATPPSDPTISEYKVTVQDTGSSTPGATGYRRTQRQSDAKVAQRGYSFLVTLEHDANEDLPILWWTAEWEELGDRRTGDPAGRPA